MFDNWANLPTIILVVKILVKQTIINYSGLSGTLFLLIGHDFLTKARGVIIRNTGKKYYHIFLEEQKLLLTRR